MITKVLFPDLSYKISGIVFKVYNNAVLSVFFCVI